MGNPVRQTVDRGTTLCRRGGFTLVEVLVAIFVMGVAVSVMVSMYTSSITLSKINQTTDVATSIAEEYMNELRVHPELFKWPDFDNEPSYGDFHTVQLIDIKSEDSIYLVKPSNAVPTSEQAHERDENLYESYAWNAYARLAGESYVEIMIQVEWNAAGIPQTLCLTSLIPRSSGEGVG